MATHWNFRQILDVHPEWDNRCTAFNVGDKERCNNCGKMGDKNRAKAVDVLNKMDQTLRLRECRAHLGELAYLTMCGNPHRKRVDVQEDRVKRWNNTISAYIALEVRNKREKAHALKSKKASGMENTEETIAVELDNEET